MLTRMVSISWPCDPPASASQSAGITGVSHRAWHKVTSCMVTGKRACAGELPFVKPSDHMRFIHYHQNGMVKTCPHDSVTSHWVPPRTSGDYGSYNSRWDLGGGHSQSILLPSSIYPFNKYFGGLSTYQAQFWVVGIQWTKQTSYS